MKEISLFHINCISRTHRCVKAALAITSWRWFLTICYYNKLDKDKEFLQANFTHNKHNIISVDVWFQIWIYAHKILITREYPHMTSIIMQTCEHDEQDGTSRTDRTHLFDVRLTRQLGNIISFSTWSIIVSRLFSAYVIHFCIVVSAIIQNMNLSNSFDVKIFIQYLLKIF